MKSSVVTGKNIYETIQGKEKEVYELESAKEDVEGHFGKSYIAYELLDRQWEETSRELDKLYNKKYTTYNEPIADQG